jgi:hypothetical protein
MPYLLVFFVIYLCAIPVVNKKRGVVISSYFLQLYSVLLVLLLFLGFRGFIFSDWYSYYRFYEDCPSLFSGISDINKFYSTNNWETGFVFLSILCKTISNNYFFFQLVLFIMDLSILLLFFKRYIPDCILLGIVFCFIFSGLQIICNVLRNSKAIMLFLLSIKYIDQKKVIKYVAMNFIGTLFHASAFLFIPLYFLLNKHYNRMAILALFIIGNIIFLFQIEWCRAVLLSLRSFIPGRLGELIDLYYNYNTGYVEAYGFSIGYIERFSSFILIYCSEKKIKNDNTNIFINMFYIYSFIYLFFSEAYILLGRIGLLFISSYWIIYPRIYVALNNKIKILFLLILLFYGLLKIGQGNRYKHHEYNNALLPHKSYTESVYILNRSGEGIR